VRRTALGLALLLVPVAAARAGGTQEAADARAPRPPSVVLLVADDLGWGDVGFHDSEIRTPYLDRLARSGVELERFYAHPLCSPSRAALLTGRYPIRYGLQGNVVRPWAEGGLDPGERTLAEALRERGYRTAIVGKWHLGHARPEYLPQQRGFEHQYGCYTGGVDYYSHRRGAALDWRRDGEVLVERGYATELIAAEAVRVVEGHDFEEPLFLYVPFTAPHTPRQAPARYGLSYGGLRGPRRAHAAMVSALDAAVGEVLRALDDRGALEQTLVWFLSDNGAGTAVAGNGELRGGKGEPYEGGVRVVALASWPGVLPAGARRSDPLHVVDLFPTLVRLAGGALDGGRPLDGVDVWATLLEGSAPAPRDLLLQVTAARGALLAGRHKLLAGYGDGGERTAELYDVVADPGESRDLAAELPERAAELAARLEQLRATAVPALEIPAEAPPGFELPTAWGPPEQPAPGDAGPAERR